MQFARVAALVPDSVWGTARAAGPEAVVRAVVRSVLSAPQFQEQLAVLIDGTVVGCCCDQAEAEESKRAATQAFRYAQKRKSPRLLLVGLPAYGGLVWHATDCVHAPAQEDSRRRQSSLPPRCSKRTSQAATAASLPRSCMRIEHSVA